MKEIEQIKMRKDIEILRDKYNIKIENIDMNKAKQMRLDQFVILFAEEYKGFDLGESQ